MRLFKDWELTPQKVAIHLPTATAVVADVHLGYQQARRQRGEAIPILPVEEHLAPLLQVLSQHSLRRLAVAGDLFEGKADPELLEQFLGWLTDARLELAGIVPGNHDRDIDRCGMDRALFPEGLMLGDWCVVHGHQELPRSPVVHGHLHPCFRLGVKVNAPCYLAAPRRLILPAFSPDAAGANVLAEPRWGRFQCIVSTGEKLLDFGPLKQLQKTTS